MKEEVTNIQIYKYNFSVSLFMEQRRKELIASGDAD